MMFVSPDTMTPDPYNPLDWNRYLYARGNPIRYTDPTGHLSEDEIKNYFGVTTWDQVQAIFEKGGVLEGQWGWLATLRTAEIGDEIQFLQDSEDVFGHAYANATVLSSGILTSQNGQLFLSTSQGGISFTQAGNTTCDAFAVIRPQDYGGGWFRGIYGADHKYVDIRSKEWSRIDKVDFGVDLFGIAGDVAFFVPGIGTGIWMISEIPEILTVGKSWDQLDMGDSSGVVVDLAVNLAQIAKLVPEVGAVGNLAGLAGNVLEVTP